MRLQQWLLLAVLTTVIGCSTTYRVVDSQGQTLTVAGPQFAPHSRVDILVGSSLRSLQAAEILRMEVDPAAPFSHEGRVFYPVRLLLKDSVALPDTSVSRPGAPVFLAVEGYLRADHAGSSIRLPLAEVRALYRWDPKSSETAPAPADTTANR